MSKRGFALEEETTMALLTLVRNGGIPIFFVLGFGLWTLATAFWSALRPDARHEGFLRWMMQATLWTTVNAVVCDLAEVARYVATSDEITTPLEQTRIGVQGFYESMSPAILGFTFLALTALLAGVARRRLDARAA